MRLGGSLLFFATMSDMRSEDKPGSDFALTEPLVGCGCCVKLFDDVAACCAADADTLSFVPEMCLRFVDVIAWVMERGEGLYLGRNRPTPLTLGPCAV